MEEAPSGQETPSSMLPIPNPYILQAGIRDLVRMLPQWEGLPVEEKDTSVGNED